MEEKNDKLSRSERRLKRISRKKEEQELIDKGFVWMKVLDWEGNQIGMKLVDEFYAQWYDGPQSICWNGGVYVQDGMYIFPDGHMEFDEE